MCVRHIATLTHTHARTVMCKQRPAGVLNILARLLHLLLLIEPTFAQFWFGSLVAWLPACALLITWLIAAHNGRVARLPVNLFTCVCACVSCVFTPAVVSLCAAILGMFGLVFVCLW